MRRILKLVLAVLFVFVGTCIFCVVVGTFRGIAPQPTAARGASVAQPSDASASASTPAKEQTKPIIEVERLFGKFPAQLDKICGKPKSRLKADIPEEMPGETRFYAVAGHEVLIRIHRGKAVFVSVHSEPNTWDISEAFQALGLSLDAFTPTSDNSVLVKWHGKIGGADSVVTGTRTMAGRSTWESIEATLSQEDPARYYRGLTMAGFESLKNGVSYDEVVRILGSDGTELSRSDIGGVHTVLYQWMSRNGANINAMFQNGRLVQKAQFDLE